MILKKNYLDRLGTNKINKLSEFVVIENFKHHTSNILPKAYKNDVKLIYQEGMNYINNSEICVSKNSAGNILWFYKSIKMEFYGSVTYSKIFGINPFTVIGDVALNDIWHIGRFAIKKKQTTLTYLNN